MKFFNLLLIAILLQSCENNSKQNKEQEVNHSNHDHDHKDLFLDSIPSNLSLTDTLIVDKIIVNSDTILINRNTFKDFELINKNLSNYALTKDNYLFELNNLKYLYQHGKYGCYNNLIFLDTLIGHTCDKKFKYVKLEKVYIHNNSSHQRSNETLIWKMDGNQYKDMLALIRNYNSNDNMVNLKMDNQPIADMCLGLNVFNFDQVVPFPKKDH